MERSGSGFTKNWGGHAPWASVLAPRSGKNVKAPRVWLTSDHHFGHANIIQYCERPFEDVGEMDDALIQAWNAVVGEGDMVFHLGDLCLDSRPSVVGGYIRRLNGTIVILDNPWHHDKWLTDRDNLMSDTFSLETLGKLIVVGPMHFLRYGGMEIHMCHYPFLEWEKSYHGSVHAHGHSHGQFAYSRRGLSIDVGVDANNWTPVDVDDILAAWTNRVGQAGMYRWYENGLE